MKIEVFKNSEFGAVRVIEKDAEPWFVGKDVATILGYASPAVAITKTVDDEDKGVAEMETPGGSQKMTIINESGLYSLILKSKLPQAKKFKRWVTSEVLPSIRKHGAYMTPDKIEEVLLNPDTIIKIASELKKEQEKRKELEKKVIELKPKAFFAEAVNNSQDLILVRDFAKLISNDKFTIGEKRLFNWLRANGYLMKNNRPYQKYIDMGIFKVIEGTRTGTGGTSIYQTTKITGKGQVYLQNKLYDSLQVK